MTDPFLYDVFLSHSSKDKAVVRAVAERLRADGLRVWFDEWKLKPGDSIPAKIEEGLSRSRVLVLCMSANAFGSDWAQLEASTFRFRDPLNKERRFIPLRLDDAPIRGSLAQFLYINWLPADREQEYAKLLETCRPPTQPSSNDKAVAANKTPSPPNNNEESIDFESQKVISFRGAILSTYEVNVLRDLEKGRKDSFKPVAEIDTHTAGFIVEKDRIIGLGLGKWGYSWKGEEAQILSDSIGNLTALKILDMSFSDIEYIPETLGNLTALERLNLRDNRLAIVPDCICRLTNLCELNLNGNALTALPNCIGKLQKLKVLILEHNRISMLPNSFGELKSLEHLDLWENKQIRSFPEEILKLQSLKELSINGNNLKTIPEAIDNLKELSVLRLDMNELITLPESVGNLQNLAILTLGWNKLGSIPDSIGNLRRLRELDLWDAKLTAFPRCICNLMQLEELNLGNNKIQRIPDEIKSLKSLRTLKLYNNIITKLPESISELRKLEELYLDSNKLKSLPKTLSKLESLQKIYLADNPLFNDMDEITKEVIDKLSQKGVTIEVKKYGYK